MFTAEDFKGEPVPAVYTKNGKTLNLMVEADVLTPKFLEDVAGAARVGKEGGQVTEDEAWDRNQAQVNYFVSILMQVIAAWDLTTKEGAPLPVAPEFLRGLPIAALADLLEVCMSAAMGDKKKNEQTSQDSILDVPA